MTNHDVITHNPSDGVRVTARKRYTAICDPGHGWMSVPQSDLLTLGIADKITSHSYMDLTRAYLEEDADVTTFMNAARAAGWQVTIKSSYSDNRSWVRSKAHYSHHNVHHPLREGGKCRVLVDDTIMDVMAITKQNILIGHGKQLHYRVTRTNPYCYIAGVSG